MNTAVKAIDHAGFVVTNLDAAVGFFIDVLGFEDIQRRGELVDKNGDRLSRQFGVHPRARARFCFLGLAGAKLELLEWTAPDRSTALPRNCDAGGRHLALAVDDLAGLASRLAELPGFTVRERNERGFIYVGTPFGLELQLMPG